MAHFAEIDETGIVQRVIVVGNDDAPDPFPDSDLLGQAFIRSLGIDGEWRQTSYNATFRKNFAGIGFAFDEQRDAFIEPQPFLSWTLNEDTCQWEPPTPYPDDGNLYDWDENTTSWVLIELPSEEPSAEEPAEP